MSNFPQNLSLLRRRAGYTQESLAEALEVSRQAVSKWESGQTMPEADKLVALAELLGCTLDQLMREKLDGTFSPTLSGPSDGDFALYAAYERHMNQFAWMMAAGVALILLGVASLMAVCALLGAGGLAVLPLLLCVAAAVFLFIFGGISHSDFTRSYPRVPNCCPPAAWDRFHRLFPIGIAGAVAAILLAVGLLVALASTGRPLWGTALFFQILAAAVGLLTLLGILHGKYGPAPASGLPLEFLETRESEEESKTSTVIMSAATILFLLAGFLFHLWHIAWIVFPIGGILCGMVTTLQKK